MEIKTVDKLSLQSWDDYVLRHPEATFFHKMGWKRVIEKAFGHDVYYLYAVDNDVICGILPLAHIKSQLFGNALVSTPFCVYGGILYSNDEAKSLLDEAACSLSRKLKVDYLEYRNKYVSNSNRPVKNLYVTFRKKIDPIAENNFLAIPRKQRAMIRKGIAAGLESVIDRDVNRFYDSYSESLRNLGTPVNGISYFKILKEEFMDDCEIISVELNGKVLSSVMIFYFRDEVLPYYGGGGESARDLYANDFMYWGVMNRALERGGITIFDFGRSKIGTGSYRFKEHWGFEATNLYYEYELIKLDKIPEINPLNPKYQFFISAWKRLPVSISKIIGPLLARDLG